jgi:hypothetical protein
VAVSNLTDTYSFFSRVYDTQDFDRYGLQYINNIAETKLADTMGCNNADSTVIRYERTVLCGIWTSSAGALACNQYYRESGHSEGGEDVSCRGTRRTRDISRRVTRGGWMPHSAERR